MLSKRWHSETRMVSSTGIPMTSSRSFSVIDIRKDILKPLKAKRSKLGLPRRKMLPASLWILDSIIDDYFEKYPDRTLEYVKAEKNLS